MGFLLFLSNGLLAIGPVVSIFVQNIFSYPARTVISVVGAFFYFCALVLTGSLFTICKALGVGAQYIAVFAILSILFQELARYGSYIFMKKARPTFEFLNDAERTSVASVQGSAISMGAGFALAASVYSSINVLVLSLQPGVPGINAMQESNPVAHSSQLFLTRSLEASATGLLNFFWTLIMFNTLDSQRPANQKNRWLGMILFSHLANTAISLLAYSGNRKLAWVSISVAWLLVLVSGASSWYMFGGSKSTLQAAVSNRRTPFQTVQNQEIHSSLSRNLDE